MPISPDDFKYICDLGRREAAIVLEPGKEYLVESRLGELARSTGFPDYTRLIAQLRTERGVGQLAARVIDSLTTNETLFFRDHHPFEALKKVIIPDLISRRAAAKRLTIWSGACSTGQEAYSIVMLLLEHFPVLKDWDVKVIATDLSPTVLKRAAEGAYSQTEVNRGLPAAYLIKYFTKQGDRWNISPLVKSRVTFQNMNLVQPWPIMPPFDLVFLRNVMIYFDVPTKKAILDKIRGCMLPHASLFLGSAETTVNLHPAFTPCTVGTAVAYTLAATQQGATGAAGAKAA